MSLTQTLLRSPVVAALTAPHGIDRYLELYAAARGVTNRARPR